MNQWVHNRRRFLIAGASTASAFASPKTRAYAFSRQSAAELAEQLRNYLWRCQHDDGRWASETYAVLGSGQALTPFVLFALLQSDPDARRSAEARKALDWIDGQLRGGVLGIADPDVLEYPLFATAFALRCFQCVYRRGAASAVMRMRQNLIRQQFTERNGFGPDHLAYGGWGFGGQHATGETGHVDLAHVRWALSALSETEDGDTLPHQLKAPYQLKAQRFLRLVQKNPDEDRPQPLGGGIVTRHPRFDGGFYFSPIVLAANKGRIQRDGDRTYFRSYATATCDGVLALIAAGVDRNEARVAAAKKWLERNPSWDHPAGIPTDYPEPWGEAVYFYHQAVRAEAYHMLDMKNHWASLLVGRLSRHLQPDGSIYNRRCGLMKEDDPIMCSALALIALSHASRCL